MYEESLEKLPGVYRDEYGNLRIPHHMEREEKGGPREHTEYIMSLEPGQLKGTKLNELLDWLRWGSETGVMWECTLAGLIGIIEQWLRDNPDSDRVDFGVEAAEDKITDWQTLWSERGLRSVIGRVYVCACGEEQKPYDTCDNCGQRPYEMETIDYGVRGRGEYNATLHGADGGSVAAAVWLGRKWFFVEPDGFNTDPKRLVSLF